MSNIITRSQNPAVRAFLENPCNFWFCKIPKQNQTMKIVELAINADIECLQYVSERFLTKELVLRIIEQDIRAFYFIPSKILDRYHLSIAEYLNKLPTCEKKKQLFNFFNYIVNRTPCGQLDYLQYKELDVDVFSENTFDVEFTDNEDGQFVSLQQINKGIIFLNELERENDLDKIYYISDIHLEHQLAGMSKNTYYDVWQEVNRKIQEMLSVYTSTNGFLLVAGDVAHSVELFDMFYSCLKGAWHGPIICVLGNHELWNNHPKGKQDGYISPPVENVVENYANVVKTIDDLHRSEYGGIVLLNNSLYMLFKNNTYKIIGELELLEMSDDDLRQILIKSTKIILGGVGFSGLNTKYNAEMGLYGSTVSNVEQDRFLSNKFRIVYEKVARCAGNRQVIVLTHTPISNWTNEKPHGGWIYINGHTHHNFSEKFENGAILLSDNQVGYLPKAWPLKCFVSAENYDPFEEYLDGIYKISKEEYQDFNCGRFIVTGLLKWSGDIYMLKKSGYYLFLLQSTSSLCILSGNRRKKVNNTDVNWYYENMDKYVNTIISKLVPYRETMKIISKEIKSFGGDGNIHGCIIDIDFYNHIYYNPIDGCMVTYYAEDMTSRKVYKNISSLLKETNYKLYKSFERQKELRLVPVLDANEKKDVQVLEDEGFNIQGTEIYKMSNLMRALQYIFDNHVIRVWSDEVLQQYENEYEEKRGIEGAVLQARSDSD